MLSARRKGAQAVSGASRSRRLRLRRSSPVLGVREPARVIVGLVDGIGRGRLLRGPLLDVEAVRIGDLEGSSRDLMPACVGVDLSALRVLELLFPSEVDVREGALAADGTAGRGTGSVGCRHDEQGIEPVALPTSAFAVVGAREGIPS